MISFRLHCDAGHEFDAWFRNSDDFDAQSAGGLVSCPSCGSAAVEKSLMAPAVASGRGRKRRSEAPAEPRPDPAPTPEKVQLAIPDPRQEALVAALREMRRMVAEHADYVGDRFAEEARKIHYREVEHRSIYGEASVDDAKALAEEGIEVHPLPVLPEDRD